ncbi:MAG TPA: RNA 2',3'-cyclic phosphodiesterase, partial [Rhodobiaceae bacterium]|nr:RNA 2',3'-cyclic phosphodiesterase [Rhodobiaceae bacterium]
MIRLFTALEIPDEVAEKLIPLQRGINGARWIERPDFHITLRFIGDVAENVADDIDEALA